MDWPPFHVTRRGQEFFEATLPRALRAIEGLNERLDRLGNRPADDHLVVAIDDLVNAAQQVLDTEIVPGSEATREAFQRLRERMATAKAAADAAR